METWREQFYAQHLIHQDRSFVILSLVFRAKPGAHFVLFKGTSSCCLCCGCWEVNFSLAGVSLHSDELFI